MSLTVTFEVQAREGMFEALQEMFSATLPDTRSFAGCIDVAAYTDRDRPNTIYLIEQWASREAYDKYLSWRRETGAMDTLAGMLSQPPTIRFLDQF